MYPPHLPPPTSSIKRHNQWQWLKIILLATAFGLIAGLTGSIIAIAFIWPSYDVTTAIVSRLPRANTEIALDDKVVTQLNNTIFTVYKKITNGQGTGYFTAQDKIGEAVVGVSSGWIVTVLPNDLTFNDWRVLGPDDSLYKVEKVLPDKQLGLLYLKISPFLPNSPNQEQFKVAHFSNSFEKPATVFVRQGGTWEKSTLRTFSAANVPYSHSDMIPAVRLELNSNYSTGSIVVNSDGVVIGFVDSDQSVIPAYSVITSLTGIENKKTITYQSYGLEGWYSEEWPIVEGGERVSGFLVTNILRRLPLNKGDIIIEINGHPVNFATWWSNLSDDQAKLTVLRDNQSVEVTLTR